MKETIYKKDTKGKLRFLTISTEGNLVVQESGLLEGKAVINKSACIGKNIGKSNETTPEQQAFMEASSKLNKKLEEGYYLTKELAESEELILPMLAKSYDDEKDKIEYPCYVQPKLDGMRCTKRGKVMVSRTAKLIETMPHIAKELPYMTDALDGELYAHGKTFQENMRLIKKYREGESEQVKYHVYDLVLPNHSFIERYNILATIVQDCETIEFVPTYKIESEAQLRLYHSRFIEEGYEGTMIRWGDAGYKVNGRSSNLLKFKDFQDIACKIVDVVPSEKRPTQGVFICELNGKTFGCGMRYSHEERVEVLTNKANYIGEIAEIRFFEYTDEGLPRFPVCVGVRLDK